MSTARPGIHFMIKDNALLRDPKHIRGRGFRHKLLFRIVRHKPLTLGSATRDSRGVRNEVIASGNQPAQMFGSVSHEGLAVCTILAVVDAA
jgi:hypothetical protein